ncbi:MAG: winged helix-turn-helix transcriptional regulator [Opitutaceae bacterium]|nr:winged helix-turn-helix transcriptional regulator [Opitutaceae bacterium]
MVNLEEDSTNRVFKALSDSTRRKILQHISREDATVTEIARPFDVSGPAISKHLKILEEARLITRFKNGTTRRFKLNTEPLSEAQLVIQRLTSFWMTRLAHLDTFLENETKSSKNNG